MYTALPDFHIHMYVWMMCTYVHCFTRRPISHVCMDNVYICTLHYQTGQFHMHVWIMSTYVHCFTRRPISPVCMDHVCICTLLYQTVTFPYWSDSEEDSVQLERYTVTLLRMRQEQGMTVRILRITHPPASGDGTVSRINDSMCKPSINQSIR